MCVFKNSLLTNPFNTQLSRSPLGSREETRLGPIVNQCQLQQLPLIEVPIKGSGTLCLVLRDCGLHHPVMDPPPGPSRGAWNPLPGPWNPTLQEPEDIPLIKTPM